MKKILIIFLLTFSIGCTAVLINEKSASIQANTPTKETIMIDAGHGGYDAGSISYNNDREKDITLKIALSLGKKLKANGYNVVYTRKSDTVTWPDDNTKDLQARCDLATKKKADYFISIHLNSSEYEANGYEIYCDFNNKKTKKLSKNILKQLDTLDYSTNRGLQDTNETALYVVVNNKVPAILIETGFITDNNDLTYMLENTDALTSAMAKGIEKSLEKSE